MNKDKSSSIAYVTRINKKGIFNITLDIIFGLIGIIFLAAAVIKTDVLLISAIVIFLLIYYSVSILKNRYESRKIKRIKLFLDNFLTKEKDIRKRITDANFYGLEPKINELFDSFYDIIGSALEIINIVAVDAQLESSSMEKISKENESLASQIASISSAIDEISSSHKEMTKSSKTAKESSILAVKRAKDGNEMIENIIEEIKIVSKSIENLQDTMSSLNNRSKEIGEVISLISDIADQTNLLALNAAIEAARAGEQGRGFAVVADEVRKLAERTSKSTSDTRQIIERLQEETSKTINAIKDSVENVKNVSDETKQAEEFFQKIIDAANDEKSSMDIISSSAEQLQIAVSDVEKNLSIVQKVSGETTKMTKKSQNISQSLSSLSHSLKKELSSLKLDLFGIVPLESAVIMKKKFEPLIKYLNKSLDAKFISFVAESYEDSIEEIGGGVVQLAYMTPSTFLAAKNKYGVIPLVYAIKNGSPTYKSAIVVSKNSTINSIKDLKGKRIAFGSKMSTGSTLVPTAMLKKDGIELKDLALVEYLGSHDAVANGVIQGDFDAGGLMDSVCVEFKDSLKVLEYSTPIPQFPICVNPKIDRGLLNKIKDVLLKADKDTLTAIDPGYTAFTAAAAGDFDEIKKLLGL
ncbi:MAG: phosphate/phosphite/phosphonate ABC transporter substrate-binding protein [Deltaproteobacteria bacterium]|jgi:phosphate/phosphite/phosphonate ABC transporter binding protein|nr:phosphate/phosphite/phosphonate ABC transporter substrate-binding protein [Deltaproteobacteria bacterium]MCL5879808.1 phosphate/phosphite/phosphonate ABC transporter substrate-binding protein [Deltaproteobacteria bacterium]MDA8303909.1 phosphate/phosphite/phosphonate ABC transporter substrate-binding protein [Deltaproteobacteria bacterium]